MSAAGRPAEPSPAGGAAAGLARGELREVGAQTILYFGWPVGSGALLLLEEVGGLML